MHLTEEELIDHVLGETNDHTDGHIAGCPTCREDAQTLGDALALTRDLPPPPEGHFDEVWSRVEWRLPPRPLPRTPSASLLATAGMLAVVVAAAVVWVTATRSQPQTPSVSVEKKAPAPPKQAPGEQKPPKTDRPFMIVEVNGSGSSTDPDRDADDLAAIAGNGKSLHERIDAVNALSLAGTTHADDNLAALYRARPNQDLRPAIIHALYVRMSTPVLEKLMREEKDPQMQKRMREALRMIEWRERRQYLTGQEKPRW